jgi:hypothetical protein
VLALPALALIFPSAEEKHRGLACTGDRELAQGRGTRRGRTDATRLHRRDGRRRLVKSRTWWRRRFSRRQPTPPPSAHLPAPGQRDAELSSRPVLPAAPTSPSPARVLHRSRRRGSPSSSPADAFSIGVAFPCTSPRQVRRDPRPEFY